MAVSVSLVWIRILVVLTPNDPVSRHILLPARLLWCGRPMRLRPNRVRVRTHTPDWLAIYGTLCKYVRE